MCYGPFADSGSMLTTRAVSILPNHPVSMLTARVVSILPDLLGSMMTARVVCLLPRQFINNPLFSSRPVCRLGQVCLPGPFVDCWSGKYITDVELQCVVLENAGHARSMLRRQ